MHESSWMNAWRCENATLKLIAIKLTQKAQHSKIRVNKFYIIILNAMLLWISLIGQLSW